MTALKQEITIQRKIIEERREKERSTAQKVRLGLCSAKIQRQEIESAQRQEKE